MTPLTPRQAEVLAFLRSYLGEHGYPPTVREIGREIGVTPANGVLCHLKALIKKGHISRASNKSRGITLLGAPCPCCGGTGVAPSATQDHAPAVPITSQDSNLS